MFRHLGVLLAVLCGLAGNAQVAAATGTQTDSKQKSFIRNAAVPAWVVPSPAIPSTARQDAVVLRMADTQVRIDRDVSVYAVRAIQVNDQAALASIGQFSVDYMPAWQSLQLHEVAILRDGRKLDRSTAATRLLDSEPMRDQGMYGGAATLQLVLQDVRIGDTLLVRYTLKGSNPVFGGHWFHDFAWDSAVPAEYRRLVVMHPEQRPVHWRQSGDFRTAAVAHRREGDGGNVRLVFEEKGIEALEWEPGIPPEYSPGRTLEFSEFQDWGAVGDWAAALFPVRPASPALAALARQISLEPSPARRAAAALRWVQNEVRYVSVSIGANSHRPQAPEMVLKNRFGDCKDKAYLLVSLLRLLGIDAVPVLVSAQRPLAAARRLPSPEAFDHVIVRLSLDGTQHYVDATRTGQKEALEALPVPFPGAAGLPATPGNGSGRELATMPPRRDVLDFLVDESFALDAFDGPATLVARREYRGDYAAAMRRAFAATSANALKKHVLELYEKQYPGVALTGLPVLKDDGERFELVAELTLPKPVTSADGMYSFPIENRLVTGALELPDKLVRAYPFMPMAGPLHGRHVVRLSWPPAARLNDVPGAFAVANGHFAYRHDYLLRGNVLHYEADYRVTAQRVPPEGMQGLHDAARLLAERQVGSFHVAGSSLVAQSLQHVPFRAAVSATATQSALAALRKRKQGDDDTALCSAAFAAALAGEYLPVGREQAIGMARAELAQRTGSAAAKLCRATVDFIEGKVSEETGRVLASLEEDPAGSSAHYLAWAQLFAGDRQAALATSARRAAALELSGTATLHDLLRHAALTLRSGAPLPEALRQALSAPVNTGWPAPVGRLLTGESDAASLLASAEGLQGAHRELALAEAWYYIGIMRLGAADAPGARLAFRHVQADGVRSTAEYQLSVAELAAMESRDPDLLAGIAAEGMQRDRDAAAYYELCAGKGVAECRFALGYMRYHGKGIARDHGKAIALLRLAAAQEVPEAQNLLGLMYLAGEGVERDRAEGGRWLRKAADNLDFDGLLNAGGRYVMGVDVGRDVERGTRYLRQAAALGNAGAQAELGGFLMYTAPEEAGLWNRVAATRGVVAAKLRLVDQMRTGRGMPADGPAAFALASTLAEDGVADAQEQLGRMYESGTGIGKDRAAALRWYRKAAAGGSANAKMWVGLLLTEGERTPEEYAEARRVLDEALEGGVPTAARLLGALYRDGRGGPVDLERAAAYFQRAAAAGQPNIAVKLALLYHFDAGDPAKAVEWYRKAVAEGSALAMNNLGDLYERGVGVEQDYDKAIALYRQAARLEEPAAFVSLASLYAAGKGLRRDPVLGLTYYEVALRLGRRDERLEGLQRQVTPGQAAAARAAAGQWTKTSPLPGT